MDFIIYSLACVGILCGILAISCPIMDMIEWFDNR
jgi:hypothetical protein